MVANYPLSFRANPYRNVRIRLDFEAHLMSVRSVLHKIVDEMNRPHLHDEIDEPEAPTEAPEKEEETDAAES